MTRRGGVGGGVLLLTLVTFVASAAGPKRVLILDSFGREVMPFSAVASTFRTSLARELGEPVDIYETSLEQARFANPRLEEPLADLIEHGVADSPVDLVVPIGAPAARFAVQYRDRLFKQTPLLFAGVDPRLIPPEALRSNATLVTQKIDLMGMMADMLQMQPDTTNVVVVFGASPLEKLWVEECRREWQAFTNRVGFAWLDTLSLPQMQERIGKLPPHSFIFFGLLVMDAARVPYDGAEAIKALHTVANAPIFGPFSSQFGLGTVGGRLYMESWVGGEAAKAAVRILRGENATGLPQIVGAPPPVYDWRELTRWGIRLERLPAGSVVEFRTPTFWEQYHWYIVGVMAFGGFQTLLLFGLFVNTQARKRINHELRESEERMTLAAEAAGLGVWMWNITDNRIWGSETWRRLFGFPPGADVSFENVFHRIHPEDREIVEQELRDAATNQDNHVREYRIVLPDGTQRWIASCGRMHTFVPGQPDRMFGAALDITARKGVEEDVRQLSLAVEQSPVSVVITDTQGKIIYVNRKFSEVSGYAAAECLGQNPRILKSGESAAATYKALWASITRGGTWQGEFHNRKRNGELYWEWATIAPLLDATGRVTHFVGIKEDITARKETEAVMHDMSRRLIRAHEAERARLARELHDDVTQRLARLAIDAGRVERGVDGVAATEMMRSIREGLVRLSEDIHALSYRLHPSVLEDLGLAEALKAECERFSRQESIPAVVTLRELPAKVPPETALCLFRVAQEALRNVARHSQARRVEVSVRVQDDSLQLAVLDDGVGFDFVLQKVLPSLGLASMRERVLLVHGELDIESAPGRGTTILVSVPLRQKLKAEG